MTGIIYNITDRNKKRRCITACNFNCRDNTGFNVYVFNKILVNLMEIDLKPATENYTRIVECNA